VLSWLDETPHQDGFPTDLWTTQRLAQLVPPALGHRPQRPHYLSTWLRARDFTRKKPRRVPAIGPRTPLPTVLRHDVAKGQALARRHDAYLVLLDEAGLLARCAPRSWARRGHPPQLPQALRQREKVSVAAALWLSPARDRLGLCYRTAPR